MKMYDPTTDTELFHKYLQINLNGGFPMASSMIFTRATIALISASKTSNHRPTHHANKFCSHRGFPGEGPPKGDISSISANVSYAA